MKENKITTKELKKTSPVSNASNSKKHDSEPVNTDPSKSKNNCRKLMALHDALQDPITTCESF